MAASLAGRPEERKHQMRAKTDPPCRPEPLAPGLRRLIAPNPSPMTERGTNTYLLGRGTLAVIDPGPAIPAHLEAILAALGPGERIGHILVTHSHLDHSPLARPLAEATGAPVLAFGPSTAGRSPAMAALAAAGLGGGEGVDAGFAPDVTLADGAQVEADDWRLTALWTPGHFGNHLCFAAEGLAEGAIFSGDHVMGWASSLISPPDGDMAAYMASLARLAAVPARRLYPGHGAPGEDPAGRIAELTAHRRAREAAIRAALTPEPRSLSAITAAVYTDVPAALRPAAERNALAHLLDLAARNIAAADRPPSLAARWRRS
jgi:hydroxyacylglutathione hydrolase